MDPEGTDSPWSEMDTTDIGDTANVSLIRPKIIVNPWKKLGNSNKSILEIQKEQAIQDKVDEKKREIARKRRMEEEKKRREEMPKRRPNRNRRRRRRGNQSDTKESKGNPTRRGPNTRDSQGNSTRRGPNTRGSQGNSARNPTRKPGRK